MMESDVIIIVPARGGSKRVPRKNVRLLGGKPLLSYTLEQICDAGLAQRAWVSTEDAEVASLAKEYGIGIIDRPAALAMDDASTESVLLHALDTLHECGENPTWIMTLPPTHPFRTAETLTALLDKARTAEPSCSCLFTVTESLGDFWRMHDGSWERLFRDAPRSQQERKAKGDVLYEENSAVYLTRIAALRSAAGKPAAILGTAPIAFPLSFPESWDINTEDHWILTEALLAVGVMRGKRA